MKMPTLTIMIIINILVIMIVIMMRNVMIMWNIRDGVLEVCIRL